jgi:hypothetical protein
MNAVLTAFGWGSDAFVGLSRVATASAPRARSLLWPCGAEAVGGRAGVGFRRHALLLCGAL